MPEPHQVDDRQPGRAGLRLVEKRLSIHLGNASVTGNSELVVFSGERTRNLSVGFSTLSVMEYAAIDALRERHPAWRLLRAANAVLILSFLGEFFVEGNRGACPASEVAAKLDDHLHALNVEIPAENGEERFPKDARSYLEDWAVTEYLRRFYPPGDDEVHYEATPAFEKAYAWVMTLQGRSFVGTESRLHTVVELLRQIVHGTEVEPEVRLAELRRRRDQLDTEIAAVEAGVLTVMDATGVRDRYQQLSATARELLADFREVEENFRRLDRAAREKIAAWDGSKGELLAELVGSRSEIAGSDQGRSFQAFYDFLLSESRQTELAELLVKVSALDTIEADQRIRGIHHDWSEAADRAQRTVRQISEQLRRFLDDRVWLENRRVIDLVRSVEGIALELRAHPPTLGLTVDQPGIEVALPFERPLYQMPAAVAVESRIAVAVEKVDAELLFTQTFVDQARLIEIVRSVLPERSMALLSDVIAMHPIEQGAAEIVGYLALNDDEVTVDMDDTDETLLEYGDPADPGITRRARLPKVTVRRR
jgi:flagellar motility protein MotE (MotC chaperone)